MRYNPTRARKLVRWSQPWHHFGAKPADPSEPSTGRLVSELGDQLQAAGREIDRLLLLLPAEQRLAELRRMNAPSRAATTVSIDALFKDMYPRAGERIKQWVVDTRKQREREVATCPRVDVVDHRDNTGAECRNVGGALWVDLGSHDCCHDCEDLGAATADRPDIAAWRADRATWPAPCSDRSVLSDEIAEDVSLREHPLLAAVRGRP